MHGNLSEPQRAATIRTANPVSQEPDTAAKDGAKSGSEWFSEACTAIYGKDAGLALHLATAVPERSCYRYASGESDLRALVLRLLIHSDQGEPFFRAFMEGCTAAWWLEHERHRRMGAAADHASTSR